MTTKTESLTVEQAERDLEDARSKHQATVAAVIAGSTKTTAKDVADAQDAIRFAELRLELAKDTNTARADLERLQQGEQIVSSLVAGEVAQSGREVVECEAHAIAAIRKLFAAATTYRRDVSGAALDLQLLRIESDRVHVGQHGGEITVDGVLIHGSHNYGDWTGDVLLGAIHRALHPFHEAGVLGDKAGKLDDLATRALAGWATPGESFTATEQLASQLDLLKERQA